MISEFQTSSSHLLAFMQEALRARLSAAVIDPFTVSGQEVWAERITLVHAPTIDSFRGNGVSVIIRSDASGEHFRLFDTAGQNVEITQDVEVRLSTRAGVVFTPVATRTFTVRFGMSAAMGVAGVNLFIGLDAGTPVVLAGAADPDLLTYLQTQLGRLPALPPQVIPYDGFFLPNTNFRDKVNDGSRDQTTEMRMLNGGAAVSADGGFLSIRLETVPFPNTVQPWTSYYAGGAENRLNTPGQHGFLPKSESAPWVLFIEGDAFTRQVQSAVESALSDARFFDFAPGVSVLWSAPGGLSRISVSFTGHKTVTTILGEDIGSDIRIDMTLDMSVPSTNQIQMDVTFRFDVAIAGIDVSTIATLIADLMLRKLLDSSNSGSALLGGGSLLDPIGKDIECTLTSASTLVCRGAAAPPPASGLVRSLRDSLGLAEGIVLMGSGDSVSNLPDPRPSVEATGFSWTSIGPDCSGLKAFIDRAAKTTVFDALVAEGSVSVVNSRRGARPLVINAIHVQNDPLKAYQVDRTGTPNHYLIYVDCTHPPPSYSCDLAIHTNGGIALASLAAPQPISEERVKRMVESSIKEATSRCFTLVNPWPQVSLNPQWLVDPSPELGPENYVQIWEFNIPASAQGGAVTVIESDTKAEVRIAAAAGLELSASFATGRGKGLLLRFHLAPAAPGWRALGEPLREVPCLGIVQSLLCKATQLSLGAYSKATALFADGSRVFLASGGKSGIAIHDLTSSAPAKVSVYSLEGLMGLDAGPSGGVLAWGDFGLISIGVLGEQFVLKQVLEGNVTAVARLSSHWYAATAEGIVVLDCELERQRWIARPRGLCGSLCALRGQLLWISGGEAYQLAACGSKWTAITHAPNGLPRCLETVRVSKRTYLFARRESAGGSLWSLQDGRLSVLSEFAQDPWFLHARRLNQLFAHTNREGVATIYNVVGIRSQ